LPDAIGSFFAKFVHMRFGRISELVLLAQNIMGGVILSAAKNLIVIAKSYYASLKVDSSLREAWHAFTIL
jgi:hypothetical protein